eukprot:SM003520S13379  [mRNA]  locus=s3520:221:700:+ [translate_table: standard]
MALLPLPLPVWLLTLLPLPLPVLPLRVRQASVCEHPGCGARIHAYCVPRKFYRATAERPCPQCGAEWPRVEEAHSVSEEAGVGPSPLGSDSQECTAGSRRGTAGVRGAAAKAKRQRGD